MRWGIIGTGSMARKFAIDFSHAQTGEMLAVASSDQTRASEFATNFKIPSAYSSYQDMVNDSNIDIVYISSFNTLHKQHIILALEHGKHVLCEKPFTMNADDAREVFGIASQLGLFVMEAMWMRFLPGFEKLVSIVQNGDIGEIQLISIDFATCVDRNLSRLFSPKLGGGVLFDRGVYSIALAYLLLGKPFGIISQAILKNGIDEQVTISLKFQSGALAVLSASFLTNSPKHASIMGTTGSITIAGPFYKLSEFQIQTSLGVKEPEYAPIRGEGFHYEIRHVEECITQGLLESPLYPSKYTIEVLEILESVKNCWYEDQSNKIHARQKEHVHEQIGPIV